ncbi:MAG TPA: NAD-dependent epimerase/dehydratase family protein [Ilumatobacteraceae bacterium]|nr:NAD-dependent epimerase/dehydratase family protein [Ilumatobacteraceae bacterium]
MQDDIYPAERLTGRSCVVTGGLGFIGSNLVRHLVALGADVSVIDALVPEHGGSPTNVASTTEVTIADIGDPAVADVVAGCDLVFNVAGQVSHIDSMTDPLRDLDLNVRSHLRFLETLRRVAPRCTVVQTSTRQVYGRPQYLPVDELHPTAPIDVNGVDKLACEQLHLVYSNVHDLHATSLRLTNVYGPNQHLGREGLGFLPVFVRQALAGEPISLFGDGSQLRDCLHVDDVCDALLRAATRPRTFGEVFNLGHTEVLTLSEIARLTVAAAGTGSEVGCVPWPDELERIDIGSFQGDFSKAHEVLGWTPRIYFADGIASTIAHFRAMP